MERIIRKILNYDARVAKDIDRDSLVADIIALSMNELSKNEKYKFPDNLDVTYADIVGGRYGIEGYKLSKSVLKDNENYINDLFIISHEVCHFAQDYCRDYADSKNRLVCDTKHFMPLMYPIIYEEVPDFFQFIPAVGVQGIASFDSGVRLLYNYFYSFYELQSFEREANEFSINLLQTIVDNAKKFNLSSKALDNLLSIDSEVKHCRNIYTSRVSSLRDLRKDKYVKSDIKERISNVIDNFNDSNPTFLKDLTTMTERDYERRFAECFDPLLLQCRALEINYDDSYARDLFLALKDSSLGVVRDNGIYSLVAWTPLEISNDDYDVIQGVLERIGQRDGVEVDFNAFMSERRRVQRERREVELENIQMNNDSVM